LAPFDADRFAGREDTPIALGDYYAHYMPAEGARRA